MRRALRILVVAVVLFALAASLPWIARQPGRWRGVRYRLLGRHPDPAVDDRTLADRVRSAIGPVEKRLDLPRVHVTVEDHVAVLHGEVGWPHEAAAVERAVRQVSGVRRVESHLHLGLGHGDMRPSEGRHRQRPRSAAMRRLLAAARSAGVADEHVGEAVRATLSVLAERIPDGERAQLLCHLPDDVRALSASPRRARVDAARVRTVPQFVAAVVAEAGDATGDRAEDVVTAVVGEVRRLVPEEADDVAAVLPSELRALWRAGAPA